jgi:nucleotide-binding universal stress UspA family protein
VIRWSSLVSIKEDANMKILLPVDGSESSLRAVQYAAKLVEGKEDVFVTLLYVHYEPVPFGAVSALVSKAQIDAARQEHAEPVLAEAEKVLRTADVPFGRKVQVGDDIAQEIAACVEKTGSDAIVMGTYGGGRLRKALIGSTANKVVHLAKVPVTLVK